MTTAIENMFKDKVLGHPAGLFVLFFTEMWERFSYYGMRALLVMFFTASLLDGGWGWPREHAYAIFGTYTSLVYLSTLLGGYFADKKIGYRYAVVIGALLMTLGHGAMAVETPFFIYLGLTLLVFGSGFFKPNMTSIISEMYKGKDEKKDGAYTIFYMGVNAGAFLGILLCGYLGEQIGWRWGFGLAGIFMLFGLLQFWFAQNIFGDIGTKPIKQDKAAVESSSNEPKLNPFSELQLGLIAIAGVLGISWIFNDPISKISEGAYNLFDFNMYGMEGSNVAILTALALFVLLLVIRIPKYDRITRDRMLAVMFFAFITIFFWAIFEQAPSSLTIFARDYTQRVLEGNSAFIFKIVNTLMTIIPLGIITWVLWLLFKKTFSKYALSNIFLAISFIIIWTIAIWMLSVEFGKDIAEVPASWFGVLNSLFIIAFAPLFSKWWESKYNPNANMKYAIGMVLLGIGMACVAIGASSIEPGAKTASVSMIWLILVYFFHTMGELCISPVALSYVSKLVPGRMIAMMFGIWYLAVAIGMKLAGVFGEASEGIAKAQGLSYFFWVLTAVAVGLGIISALLYPVIKKLMHGVR
ncbi:MAG: peptide MFS transporter [Formosa sp.]|jgi:POT family proton-dependent oligopeptide transporter|nr:peptide MFS transporter [Formosa sp.]MDA9646564.1 peptide MFS transporter [Flavobacteriaceae bacterium]MDB2426585.1 peptide MFS transporter [Flavobacteriaceae bacterium]MDC0463495.1 peptide MFS transporter [Flavobacteriaceae bacterium]MDC3198678.1 peptide MFS transporter [Flavobacteriaceae bacterium]